MHDPNCLFCKIVAGEIPCRKAHEDGDVLAFHDIRPLAPVHVLVIPKKHIATMYDCAPGDEAVFRIIVNTGRVGRQEVQHIHIHVIGGPESLGPMILRKDH